MTAALPPGGGPGVDADISLSVSTVTVLAELVADELERRQFGRPRWLTADRVAEHLFVGGGKRPRRRFRLDPPDAAELHGVGIDPAAVSRAAKLGRRAETTAPARDRCSCRFEAAEVRDDAAIDPTKRERR